MKLNINNMNTLRQHTFELACSEEDEALGRGAFCVAYDSEEGYCTCGFLREVRRSASSCSFAVLTVNGLELPYNHCEPVISDFCPEVFVRRDCGYCVGRIVGFTEDGLFIIKRAPGDSIKVPPSRVCLASDVKFGIDEEGR